MRTTLLVASVASAGIAVAAFALHTPSVAHAGGRDQVPMCNFTITKVCDLATLMKDPQFRKERRAEIRSKLTESSAAMAKELDLTTAQLRQLIELETEAEMGFLDTLLPSGPGKRPDPVAAKAVVAKQRELRSKLHADIVTALGAAKAQQFADYVKSQPARRQVDQLQVSLQSAGYPMTAEQSKSLIAMVAAEQERHEREITDLYSRRGSGASPGETIDARRAAELEIDEQENARIVQGATSVLSPLQLRTLQKMLADDIAKIRLHYQAHAGKGR